MSARGEIRRLRREREKLLEHEQRLRTDLRWEYTRLLMMVQAADTALTLVGRLARRRRPRR